MAYVFVVFLPEVRKTDLVASLQVLYVHFEHGRLSGRLWKLFPNLTNQSLLPLQAK